MSKTKKGMAIAATAISLLAVGSLAAGCGGGAETTGAAASATTTAATAAPTTTEQVADPACAEQVGDFVTKLQELDSRLGIGLNFEHYSTNVSDTKVVYDEIAFDAMSPDCVSRVGVPAENAFNAYVKAYNVWNKCVGDIDCDNDSINPKLQLQWAKATGLIDRAERNLEDLSS
jgi:hypothetical protein